MSQHASTEQSVSTEAKIVASSLFLAPAALLISYLALPGLRMNVADQLDVITANSSRYYVFILFGIIGQILLLPAVVVMMQRARTGSPKAALTGGTLALLGVALGLVDLGSELVKWQEASAAADHAQMVALGERFDAAAGAAALLQTAGLAIVVGFIVLAVALARSHAAPVWVGVVLSASMLVNIVGYAAGSTPTLVVSAVLLLASMGWIGRSAWRAQPQTTRRAEQPTPQPAG